MEATQVTLYTRTNCPLCDKAKRVLEELKAEFSFQLNAVDIESDDVLHERYQLMIPVVAIDGEEVDFGQIVKSKIRKRLLTKNK